MSILKCYAYAIGHFAPLCKFTMKLNVSVAMYNVSFDDKTNNIVYVIEPRRKTKVTDSFSDERRFSGMKRREKVFFDP
jgi:hypothetical protein